MLLSVSGGTAITGNASTSFSSMFSLFKQFFMYIINSLDGIKIIGNATLLDLNIGFTVFALIFTVVFAVVRSGVDNSISSVDEARKVAARKAARKAHIEDNK